MSNDDDLLNEYILSTQLLTDGEPIRCVTTTAVATSSDSSSLEILSGSQGGVVSRIVLPSFDSKPSSANDDNGNDNNGGSSDKMEVEEPLLEIQPGGANTRHPHQITAILSSSSSFSNATTLYVTGCRDGQIRVMDGKSHELKFVLEGHSNAVTSLSWIAPANNDGATSPWLVSGSWDGTAKVWSITEDSHACIGTLSGHENTVSVAGLPAESDTVRKVVTVSAGVAEGSAIRGHTVRIWRLTSIGDGSAIKSELIAQVANDHSGPMRDVVYDAETHSIYTCSNDGTVKIRSADDGTCTTTLAYPGGESPMFLSLCIVGDWQTKAVIAGAEDGHVVIWDIASNKNGGTTNNREAQVIAHPGCVWKVASLGNNSCDFVTACNDGNLRIFTRDASKSAPPNVLSSFSEAVSTHFASRSSGPSSEEIAKLPKWEMNALTQGRSEGQVQVFQKDGKAIAAQWSATSRTWIEVGEVTGTNSNAGTLNGKKYDHVLPIEIDVSGGGVQTLQIGYNNGENPFVTAQTFIDEHMMDQGYLAQIADYIRQRTGESGPTLGSSAAPGGGAGNSGASSSSAPTPMEVTPSYNHLPMKGYKVFDAGVDKKGLTKVVAKIREINNNVSSNNQLPSSEANDVLDTLSATLSTTNRYHSTTISDIELAIIHKMITKWDAKDAFPALDLARMAVLHPDAASSKRRGCWEEVLRGALDMCLGLGDGVVGEVAVPMLTMRLIANSYKGGSGSADAAGSLVDSILECANACAPSNNKNVRLSVATAILNTSSYMMSSSSTAPPSSSSAVLLLDVVGTVVGCGKYESEPIVRSLMALGTVLLLPGGCGMEVHRVAKERSIGSMVERVSSGHGDAAKAVAKDILSILS
mmetsp:Transcript_25452/g.54765  ORF Transcript_25452/g.54765 Transcript_25452/m.54765 type:complete len:867 (+) Transcript_25452:108-2708(+)|eukprot:CAMPEP_0172309114 /NCGR_PEP_ID=MMETSP1058-20130122/9495_1 /TAXON_ID=83371 /ORGANISM="Detonula confervacea, Strain CCMP 353" /LENGTH=866 /DNA_ID=CAMNT_0013021675 /DNA_START=79 /DNA_END=2679 /DNA_ORIENTATION=+